MNVDPSFLSFLQQEETRAYDGTLLEEVESAINSYNGAEYGDEEEGRSQVVARDVAEVVDYMVPSLLRVLMSGDRIAEFEPDSPDYADAAEQATEKLHDEMRRRSYGLVHDFAKAGCLEKLGLIKTCVEKRKERVENILPAELLPDDLKAEGIIEAEPVEGLVDELGEPAAFRVVALVDAEPKIVDYNVPLEEFGFSPDARDFDNAPYLVHKPIKSLSDLIGMGFDPEVVMGLPTGYLEHQLDQVRNDNRSSMGTDRQGVLRKVRLLEEYVFFDLNGDGIAERLCVHRVENTILSIEEVDYQPFEYWCAFPMPGKLVGQSLADKVVDIQRVNTALERNMLDSLYFSTAPGTYIDETSITDNTIEDLLTVRPGRLVRYKGEPPIPEQRNDTSAIAMQAIEFKIGQREQRTGITRLNQGLDADTLNKTATGQALLQAQGQQIEEYLARNLANALGRWFLRKYKLMRQYMAPFMLRVDGEYVEVDPSQWPEEMDMKVRVGLGSGKKDQRLAYRREIGQYQAMLMESGSPLVSPDKMHKNLSGMARDMGFNPNDMFVDPAQAPPQQEQPDPEQMKLQAEMQLQAAKLKGEQAIQQQKIEAMREEARIKAELARQIAEEEAQLAREKAEFEAQQARDKFEFERQLAIEKMQFEERRMQRDADRRDYETDAKVSQNRPGGKLDE